ncbi:MAG: hydroxyethylthiazole kinase [bacterium]|nr:hydroxyethylthiazole kinase [bacterium]
MLRQQLERVRENAPLIHNITNYVTVNDCANILLACGGSPIMADYVGEVEEITAICAGLNINMGTLNPDTISAMVAAGKKSNEVGHPVVLDPVGVGASLVRTKAANILLNEIRFTTIRGNSSEIKTLAYGQGTTKGVDADLADLVTEENIDDTIVFAKKLSERTGAVIAISGAIDIVSDANRAYVIRNGHAMMGRVTGTGCMLSALTTAYLAANKSTPLEATAAAVCAMGICGELAFKRLGTLDGNSTYRNYLIDAMYHLDGEAFEKGAKYEQR